MAKPQPIRSENIGQPRDMQFSHFGVLNDGTQSKTSTITSVMVNVLLAFVVIVIGAATKKTMDNKMKLTALTMPVEIKKIEPIKPKVVPPKVKLPEPPKIVVQPPKITIPETKLPDPPKPIVKMEEPKPVIMPAPPKQVVAMAAPKPVSVNLAQNASVPNNQPHPSAVALGSATNPIAPSSRAVSNVNLGNAGLSGMPASNTGMGPAATKVALGSGQPGGSMNGTGSRAVQGVKLGVPGGTGPTNSPGKVAGEVHLATIQPAPMPKQQQVAQAPTHSAPKVIYKPRPEYTEEAKQAHVEGTVTVHIHVLPSGAVEVVGVTNGLGHGLDESAKRAALATKFEPATDASGHPIEWDGFVNIAFQLAG